MVFHLPVNRLARLASCIVLFAWQTPWYSVNAEESWQAGAAKMVITPEQPMWMSGYAARSRPAEGKQHELWAKALALEASDGTTGLIVTLDLVGIDRGLADVVCRRLASKHGLARDQIALCTSHTHSGPVVGGNLSAMYFLDDAQQKLVDDYAEQLVEKIVAVSGEALADRSPAMLRWGTGTATFATNRRNNPEAEVIARRGSGMLVGPSDHDVPVLGVYEPSGKLRAVLFGYACHATVLSGYEWSGDYPGYAQAALEARHEGAVALFWAGCGGDQNPLPRRRVELAIMYGNALADAVDEVLAGDMHLVATELETSFSLVDLPFGEMPSREQLEEATQSDNRYEASRARRLLERWDAEGGLDAQYPYPVQAWRLGGEILFVTLGGEVVVDYALRLKSELAADRAWIAAYANDVMAYIPSRRVLAEGGYEGGGAMVYYGQPTIWDPAVEDLIVDQVHALIGGMAD